jgi:hypothetical protein
MMRSIAYFAASANALVCASVVVAAPPGPPPSQGLAAQARAAATANATNIANLTPANMTAATSYGPTDLYACSQSGTLKACMSGRSARLGVGLVAPSDQVPSVTTFVVSPLANAPLVDYVAHLRQTVYTGDWTTRATVTVTCTGGTAAWTIGGQSTSISCAATAATVQSALQALSSVGAGGVTVTGGPGGSAAYVVSYSPVYIANNRFKALTVDGSNLTGTSAGAAITWVNNWGVDTGFLFAENGYHVTGAASGDGNGAAVLNGSLFENDLRSNANVGRIFGLTAEASFAGANSTGTTDVMASLRVNSILHKDGSLVYPGTATNAFALDVGGIQAARGFADGVTSGTNTVTSASAQFTANDVGKVITGTNIAANSYIVSVTSTVATLNQPTSGSGSGLTITIAGTAQCSTCYTARFGAGTVATNGQLLIQGWRKDEDTIKVSGANNQTADLFSLWSNSFGSRVMHFSPAGALNLSGGITTFEGLSYQATVGYVNGVAKGGIALGNPLDTGLYRDGVGRLATGGCLKVGPNIDPGTTNAVSTATGPCLYGSTGAPGTVRSVVSGDMWFNATVTIGQPWAYQYDGTTWRGVAVTPNISTPTVSGGTLTGGGTAQRGEVAQTAAGSTTVTITFGTAFPTAPYCQVSSEAGKPPSFAASTTGLTLTTASAAVASDKYTYACQP